MEAHNNFLFSGGHNNVNENEVNNSNNGSINSSSIPNVIGPGVTIPIYEDGSNSTSNISHHRTSSTQQINGNDVDTSAHSQSMASISDHSTSEQEHDLMNNMDGSEQSQKIGIYRSKTGKFSNTLSNLIPSLSARLHTASKKKNKTGNSSSGNNLKNKNQADEFVDLRDLQNTLPFPKNNINSDYIINNSDYNKNIKTKQFKEKLLNFTKKTDSPTGETTKITTINGITINNDGAPSIISSSAQDYDYDSLINFPDASSFFIDQQSSITNNKLSIGGNDNFQQPRGSVDSVNLMAPIMPRSRNNTISSQITGISSMVPPQQHKQSSTLWVNNSNNTEGTNNNNNNFGRNRALSNASSVYLDATNHEQKSKIRNPSIYSTDTGKLASGNVEIDSMVDNISVMNRVMAPKIPLVADEIDPISINWVTMDPSVPPINQISNLLPTDTISISNVFSLQKQQVQFKNAVNLTSTSLVTLCSKYGEVKSARTLNGFNMALVEFINVDTAIRALENLQGKEVSMIGAPSTVCFAKILPMHHQQQQMIAPPNLNTNDTMSRPLLYDQLYNGALTFQQQENVAVPIYTQDNAIPSDHNGNNGNMNTSLDSNQHESYVISSNEKEICPFVLPPPTFKDESENLKKMLDSFGLPYDMSQVSHIITKSKTTKIATDTSNFGMLPSHATSKDFDAPKLRELRKIIDANGMTDLEIEQLAMAMLDELPELSSDYLGNTIVQKLFQHSSDIIRDIMLRKTHKYLSSMGVHKNGTWACQKMIKFATTPRQKLLVSHGVKEYCTSLFNDQFGNYVIQCVLKFGFPWNNFVFEAILANFWVLVQNRYGSRAVRACAEADKYITHEQVLILSAYIVLYSRYLTTNSNGTLLVTWFLDSSSVTNRYNILATMLSENIVELATHKLASLTILKILNYRGDENARKIILTAIFGDKNFDDPTDTLFRILSDATIGTVFIHKVLSMTTLDTELRSHAVQVTRKIILENPSMQHNRRLLEELSLTSVHSQPNYGQIRNHSSISHIYANDVNHMRQLSVSSGISNGSRQTGNNMSTQVPQVTITHPAQTNNAPGAGYFDYPGVFPAGFSNMFGYNGGNHTLHGNDDLISQLDMLSLNNGEVVLPKLSLTNYSNKNNSNILQQSDNHNDIDNDGKNVY